jgi:peptidoglycan/xylan/chitin deacetylase (PgdA/CDA1 family)
MTRDNEDLKPPYSYSPLSAREPLRWPNGAKVALYVALNIEHYRIDQPEKSISPQTIHAVPDPLNYGWRDYGSRVGVWRMIDLFDELGIEPTVMINSEACAQYPQIVDAGLARNWSCWVAHGKTNSIPHIGLELAAERSILTEVVSDIEAATGHRPQGWLGPALTETFNTPSLLRELGVSYVLDWACDDQPLSLDAGDMIAIPYDVETNDITSFLARGMNGPDYEQMLVDQLEQLLEEGAATGRVMSVAVHTFIAGQPFRFKYLKRALRRIVEMDGVWLTTTDQIADHFRSQSAAAGSSSGDG